LPFFTTKPGGSGVGLALVREVVDAHRGQLMLTQREGGGAQITLHLPGKREFGAGKESLARLTLTRA
jgi:signal transduction histidine kinase